MHAREVRPGLWHWTARHPDWTPDQAEGDGWEAEVSSYAYVSAKARPGAFVLVDPLVPGEDTDAFWRALDRDVERHGPPHILITIFWHVRSTPAIVDRYDGARVWAYAPARNEIAGRTPVTDVFGLDDRLPAGVEAHPAGGTAHEVAYRLPRHDAVAVGDAMIAPPGQPPRVWPDDESVRAALSALLGRPLELLLLTHGEPVLANGREALAQALA